MSKKFAHHSLIGLLSLFTLAGIIGLVIWRSHDIRLYSMPDSTMAPTLQHGDLLLASQDYNPQPGDVISYVDSNNLRAAFTGRVVAVKQSQGLIRVQGDNSATTVSISPDMVLGKTLKSVPLVGYILDILRRPAGLAILIYVPAFMMLRAESKNLRRNLRSTSRQFVAFAPVRA